MEHNLLKFGNLKEVIKTFSDEQVCIDFLVQQRWNGSPICPYCGSNKWYSIENRKRFKCGNKECYKKYSVTVGTCFHASNIPLSTWLPAMYLLTNHKKGISSCQLAKDLGICQKTAWFMLHRMRASLKEKDSFLLKNIVEVDEVYAGGSIENMSNKKRKKIKENLGNGVLANKTMIVGMIERGGALKLEVAGGENDKRTIMPIVLNNVDKSSVIMTDGEGFYLNIGKHYAEHHSVSHHLREYVKGGVIHTNTIEGAFSLFRRAVIGTYHKMSPKHLSRYCDEMQYRYNTRGLKDAERFEQSLGLIETRLSWKELVKYNGLTAATIIEPEVPQLKIKGTSGKKMAVYQILNGEIIAKHNSIIEAAKATGVYADSISKVVRGLRVMAGGFEWKYV